MKRHQQISFSGPLFKKQDAFGGTLMRKAKFRTARPLSKRHPIHMVLRSTQAKGTLGMRTTKNFKIVSETLHQCARKNGVKVMQFSNNGNHLHLLIKITNRTLYTSFVREFSGRVAQQITGSFRKADTLKDTPTIKPKLKDTPTTNLNRKFKLKKKFWDFRPFTRIVIGYRGYQIIKDYITLNQLEALGIIEYQPQRLKGNYSSA